MGGDGPQSGIVLDAARLPPRDALAYFRQKVNVPTGHWTDLWMQAHARGFMVAGAASKALLDDLREAVEQAVAGHVTFKDFEKRFSKIVDKHGWKHTGSTGWRAEIIYDTNMSTAFSAGRYRRMTTPEALDMFPWWRYTHHSCPHPRPQHVAWDGTILRNDDPWWNTHFPPNGWRCHCTVEVVSRPMMERRGWSVSESPAIEMRSWTNQRTGEVHQVPVGIDPGFAYNPGKAWMQNEARAAGRPALPSMGPRPAPSAPASPEIPSSPRMAEPNDATTYVPDAPAPVSPEPMAPLPDAARPDLARPGPVLPGLPMDALRERAQRDSLRDFLRVPAHETEIGTLPAKAQSAINAETPHVLLSGDTLKKQRGEIPGQKGHPELTAEEYALLPTILAHPHIIAQDGALRVAFFRRDGRDYRATIKRTGDGTKNYLVSFHRMEIGAIRRALGRMQIIEGSLDDLAQRPLEGE